MNTSTSDESALRKLFVTTIGKDGWELKQISELMRLLAHNNLDRSTHNDDKQLCIAFFSWVEQLKHVGTHASNRRYTRLQFIENTLSLAGFQLTRRDFEPWFLSLPHIANASGNWHPDDLLPYAAVDSRLQELENQVDNIEHELHQTQVALNRSKAELRFVEAERKHFVTLLKLDIENYTAAAVSAAVSAAVLTTQQSFEKSASWRLTKPLRSIMDYTRSLNSQKLKSNSSDRIPDITTTSTQTISLFEEFYSDRLIPPWEKPGYSTEVAWRGLPDSNFDRNDYSEWCKRYESVNNIDALMSEARMLADQNHSPLFSILMTVDQSPAEYFKQAVSSVQNQVYEKWELCIAVSTRTDASVIEFI